jgi:hypothetical protein
MIWRVPGRSLLLGDLLWSRLGGLNGKFFEGGWGNLGIVNLQEDLAVIQQWPPQDMQVG